MTARRLIVASLLLVFHALALGESVLSVSIPAPNDAQLNAHVYPPHQKLVKVLSWFRMAQVAMSEGIPISVSFLHQALF